MIDALTSTPTERDRVFAAVDEIATLSREQLVAELAVRRVLCRRQGHAIELLIDALERRLPAAEAALGIAEGAEHPVTTH